MSVQDSRVLQSSTVDFPEIFSVLEIEPKHIFLKNISEKYLEIIMFKNIDQQSDYRNYLKKVLSNHWYHLATNSQRQLNKIR